MKNVLITGGSRGIGAECVKIFSKTGYRVFFTYLNSEEKAIKLSEETGAVAIKADVCKDVEKVKEAIKPYGKLYALVNNAGIAQQKVFQDITDEDWDKMFDVNIKGMFLTTKAFVYDMIMNKSGRIVNVSSMWGISGASCEVHYSASKAAVIGFTKALAKELGPSGITVNCVAPGVIDTDMNSMLDEETINELANETPVQRIGKPCEVADMIMYLCGEKSGFITGQIIGIDGGITV